MRLSQKKMRQILLAVLVVAVILIIIAVRTPIESIVIQGNTFYTQEEILELLPYDANSSVLKVMFNRVNTVKDKGYVLKMEIEYPDLTHINIRVYEKEIIGYVEYLGKYLCIDNNGYIVDYTDDPKDKPIVRGVEVPEFTIYEPIEVDQTIIDEIYAIYRNMVAFDVPITGIYFPYGKINEITLESDDIKIYIGDTSRIEEKFQLIGEILRALPEDESGTLSLEYIDQNIIFKSNRTTS